MFLGHYYGIDNTDHMIKLAAIRFISFKYWHAPYNHAKAIAVTAAYDMYQECADGGLVEAWKIPKKDRFTFSSFRQTLSEQMLKYDPRDDNYPGDSGFRTSKRQPKKRRQSEVSDDNDSGSGLTVQVFKKARVTPRLCGNLSDLEKHFQSMDKGTSSKTCEVCGKNTLWTCGICKKPLCVMDSRKWNGAKCVLAFHNNLFFGLARSDAAAVHGETTKSWRAPGRTARARNARRVKYLMETIREENGDDCTGEGDAAA
mmetsp:Transcript_26912/g.45854  ORF Transcript_26912/g.45854 Transcript_26912/m.45854 type:complete len:257 (+) Transcript_26912:617-1387(+)